MTEPPDLLSLALDRIGYTHRREQDALAELLRTGGDRVAVQAGTGCIQGDAEIIVNRGGNARRTRLRDVVCRFNGLDPRYRWDPTTPTYVQREVDGIVRLGRLLNAWCSGVKTTYTVTTETGRTLRATDEHPFLTARGWLRLDELKVDDELHVRGPQASDRPRKAKTHYRLVKSVDAHPHAYRHPRFTRVPLHRLVVEADMNGLSYDAFLARIRSGDVADLAFLDPAEWAVHHRDHDHLNNTLGNLQVLTPSAHARLHADEGRVNHVLYKIVTERVESIEQFGEEMTYDLEVADDPHNFLANGVVVHNTGKSMAALTHAASMGRPGRPAVVVTMTLALTAQYTYKDAPQIAEAIGMSYTRIVGRSHYLCASSKAAGFSSDPPSDDYHEIEAWIAARDEWLDQAASPYLPECSRWELNRETGEHDESYACPGSCGGKSYGGCGARRARERGTQVHVIVTNAHCLVYHHRYPFAEILPDDIAYVLVDEAHQLPDTVSSTLAAEIGPPFGTVWQGGEKSPAVQIEVPAEIAHGRAHGVPREGCSACEHDHEHYLGVSEHDVAARLIRRVHAVRAEMCSAVNWAETWSPEERVRATAGQCQRLRTAVAEYRQWIAAIGAEQWGAPVRPRTDDDPEPEESPGVLDTIELLALTAAMDHVVASVRRDEPEIITLTRTKVAGATARYLGTPAALITGTMPRTLPARVGWPDVEPADVGHPFDYAASVKGWISRHSGIKTPPRRLTGRARDQWLDSLEGNYAARADELDRFIGDGRGLVLVPSHADTDVLRRHLVPRLHARGVPAFLQPRKGGSRKAREQVQAFIGEDGPAVLIGTDSLATGVDLPGDLLTRVAWWCLPKGFTSPADQQREALYPGYGDDRLRIKVAQGIGRLLRRETDTGWVLLCDDRFAQHLAGANGILDRHLREIVWKRLPIRQVEGAA